MKIVAKYSHLNGEEYLIVHQKRLWRDVQTVIKKVDAKACRDKVSKEKKTIGQLLYSPTSMNKAFKREFESLGWRQERRDYWVTSDERLMRKIHNSAPAEQKRAIEEAGYVAIGSYNQTDFVKNRVAVEVQFGKYSFVAHDLFVKHLHFYLSDAIDVGIEILPMKALEREMSSGVPYYERDLVNVLRQGRGVPAVPLVLIGVTP